MLYCVLHEDPKEDIRDHLGGSVDRAHGWMDNFQDLEDSFEEVVGEPKSCIPNSNFNKRPLK